MPRSAPRDPLAIGPKLRRRFYEAVVFLDTLQSLPGLKAVVPSQTGSGPAQAADSEFDIFVYKLAQVCDNDKGGSTVTAFTVLREPAGGVVYVFACNHRSDQELREVSDFATRVLQLLRGLSATVEPDTASAHLPDRTADDLAGSLRQSVLRFNKPRLRRYTERIMTCITDCLDHLGASGSGADPYVSRDAIRNVDVPDDVALSSRLARVLSKLRTLCTELLQNDDDDDAFLRASDRLLSYLDRVKSSQYQEAIMNKAKETEEADGEWSELLHHIGRLLSVHGATDILLQAPRRWPALFEQAFRVQAVPSSRPAPNPFNRKSRTMHDIIGRITSDQAAMNFYRERAAALQDEVAQRTAPERSRSDASYIDDAIVRKCTSEYFRPIVHAELLLLDWLQRTGSGIRPERFYNGRQYIGCSKPTCRLCFYCFQEVAPDVAVRPSHRNIYANWRVPDIAGQTSANEGHYSAAAVAAQAASAAGAVGAARARDRTLDALIRRIRADLQSILMNFSTDRRQHDSLTSSNIPGHGGPTKGKAEVIHLSVLSDTSDQKRFDAQPRSFMAGNSHPFRDEVDVLRVTTPRDIFQESSVTFLEAQIGRLSVQRQPVLLKAETRKEVSAGERAFGVVVKAPATVGVVEVTNDDCEHEHDEDSGGVSLSDASFVLRTSPHS
ncbi:hypothetical protein VTK73DRAFT_9785 [Phialemonium thermophilum]|uniref:Uncharacterized protein n=1 Tax=Phialemonium thermophilum TaxID=223376 RepID=A0ABR3W0D4_9PEZI